MAFSRQAAKGTPNNTANQLIPIKITGDSLVATNNPLIAEGEIGMGRDVSDAVPGGFQSAGAVNGNLRARAASILLEGVLGNKVLGGSADTFTPADSLPWWTVEKKIGSATPLQLVIQYSDAFINTLSISAPGGALATFSAGLITAGETRTDRINAINANPNGGDRSLVYPESYPSNADDLLVFHGGRIFLGDNPSTGSAVAVRDETFQSIEVVINNNTAADEYTVRPSRFLRSLTEGIRAVECNFTLVFENPDKYSKFAYGSQSANTPGYSFYQGALQLFLGNYQLTNDAQDAVGSSFPYAGAANAVNFTPSTPSPAPGSGVQVTQLNLPKLAFTGFPVALASGRIAVTTSARALKDNLAPIVTAYVRPGGAGLNY